MVSYTGGILPVHSVDLSGNGSLSNIQTTNVTLPNPLVGAQLLHADNNLYIIGGQTHNYTGPKSSIYKIPLNTYGSLGNISQYTLPGFQQPNARASVYSYSGGKYLYVAGGEQNVGNGQFTYSNDLIKINIDGSGNPSSALNISSIPTSNVQPFAKTLLFIQDDYFWLISNTSTGAGVYSQRINSNGKPVVYSWKETAGISGYYITGRSQTSVAFSNDGATVYIPAVNTSGKFYILRGKLLNGEVLEWWPIEVKCVDNLSKITYLINYSDYFYALAQQATTGSWGWYSAQLGQTGATNYDIDDSSPNLWETKATFNFINFSPGKNNQRFILGLTYNESYSAVASNLTPPVFNSSRIRGTLSVNARDSRKPVSGTTLNMSGYSVNNLQKPELRYKLDTGHYQTSGYLSMSNETGSPARWTLGLPMSMVTDGRHILSVRALDTGGNFSEVTTYYTVDTEKPTVIIYNALGGDLVNGEASDYRSGLKSISWTASTLGGTYVNIDTATTPYFASGDNDYVDVTSIKYNLPIRVSAGVGTANAHVGIKVEDWAGNITYKDYVLNSNVHLAEPPQLLESEKTIITTDPDSTFEKDRPANLIRAYNPKDLIKIKVTDDNGYSDKNNWRVYFASGLLVSQGSANWFNIPWSDLADSVSENEEVNDEENYITKTIESFYNIIWSDEQAMGLKYPFSILIIVTNNVIDDQDYLNNTAWSDIHSYVRNVADSDSWSDTNKGYIVFFKELSPEEIHVPTPYTFGHTDTVGGNHKVSTKYKVGGPFPTNVSPIKVYGTTNPAFMTQYKLNSGLIGTFVENSIPIIFTDRFTSEDYGNMWSFYNYTDNGNWVTLGIDEHVSVTDLSSMIPLNWYDNIDYDSEKDWYKPTDFLINADFNIKQIKDDSNNNHVMEFGRSYTFGIWFDNYYNRVWQGSPNNHYLKSDSVNPDLRWPAIGEALEAFKNGITDTGISNPWIGCIEVVGDDVFIGGRFYYIDGQEFNHIARYNLIDKSFHPIAKNGYTGATDDSKNKSVYQNICSFFYDNSSKKLYVGGSFTHIADFSYNKGLVSYNTQTGELEAVANSNVSFCDYTNNYGVSCIRIFNDCLYFGISNPYLLSNKNNTSILNKIDLQSGDIYKIIDNTGGNYRADSSVTCLETLGDYLYFGGDFITLPGDTTTYNSLAKLDEFDGISQVTNWNTANSAYGRVYSLSSINNKLFIGGQFDYAVSSNNTFNNVAIYNPSNHNVSPIGVPPNQIGVKGYVRAIGTIGGKAYLGGYFSRLYNSDGPTANHIAYYDESENKLKPIIFSNGYTGMQGNYVFGSIRPIMAMKSSSHNQNSVLYLGGSFTGINGQHYTNIAAYYIDAASEVPNYEQFISFAVNPTQEGEDQPPPAETGPSNLNDLYLYSTFEI